MYWGHALGATHHGTAKASKGQQRSAKVSTDQPMSGASGRTQEKAGRVTRIRPILVLCVLFELFFIWMDGIMEEWKRIAAVFAEEKR
jgi:hypothetical protein